jgi:hypothetical protein
MSDQPFYAPNRKPAPRQSRPAEHLWAIRKDGRRLRVRGSWKEYFRRIYLPERRDVVPR